MRKIILLSLLTVAIFVILTFSTASLKRQVDGNDAYGFPARFYILYSEMVYPAPTSEMTRFIFLNLVLDIVFSFTITILFFAIYKKLKKRFTIKKVKS